MATHLGLYTVELYSFLNQIYAKWLPKVSYRMLFLLHYVFMNAYKLFNCNSLFFGSTERHCKIPKYSVPYESS